MLGQFALPFVERHHKFLRPESEFAVQNGLRLFYLARLNTFQRIGSAIMEFRMEATYDLIWFSIFHCRVYIGSM